MNSLFAKTDNSVFIHFYKTCSLLCYHVLLCFIVLVSCIQNQLIIDINWNAGWKTWNSNLQVLLSLSLSLLSPGRGSISKRAAGSRDLTELSTPSSYLEKSSLLAHQISFYLSFSSRSLSYFSLSLSLFLSLCSLCALLSLSFSSLSLCVCVCVSTFRYFF